MEKIKTAVHRAATCITLTALICVSVFCVSAAAYGTALPDELFTETEAGDMKAADSRAGYFLNEKDNAQCKVLSAFFPISSTPAQNRQTSSLPKLFGLLPIKEVTVTEIERPVLTVCGTPFGLKIRTDGVVVTGFGAANGSADGFSPAEAAGIQKGDIIIKINGEAVTTSHQIADAVNAQGTNESGSEAISAAKINCGSIKMLTAAIEEPEKVKVTVMRDGKAMEFEVMPEAAETGYCLGIWTRDSCAGIGTLTFYDENSSVFAGLGHSVCDIDTGVMLPIAKGEIVPVSISGVVKGISGCPGELCGTFMSGSPAGTITDNLPEGIFGTALNTDCLSGSKLEMSFKQEVHTGEAKIITTVNGMTPKEYSVYIEKADYSGKGVKNLVVRITDPELLAVTGGIVQGMSGSPIIQNGRLAGAVTHVFVNDVTRGYGIFAENMYKNILTSK